MWTKTRNGLFLILLLGSAAFSVWSLIGSIQSEVNYKFSGSTSPDCTHSSSKQCCLTTPEMEPTISWNDTLDHYPNAHHFTALQNGGFVCLQLYDGGFSLDDLVHFIKLDVNWTVIWNQSFSLGYAKGITAIVECSDGGFGMIGQAGICSTYDPFILRFDSTGNLLWNVSLAGPKEDDIFSPIATKDGGFAFLGEFLSCPGDHSYNRLLEVDSHGNILLNWTYPGPEQHQSNSLQFCDDGHFVICGQTTVSPGSYASSLTSIAANGTLLWNQRYAYPVLPDYRATAIQCADGGFAIGGLGLTPGCECESYALIRTNNSGTLLWSQFYLQPGFQYGTCFLEAASGGFLLFGEHWNADAPNKSVNFLRTDALGNPLWNFTIGNSSYLQTQGLYEMPDHSFLAFCYDIYLKLPWVLRIHDPQPPSNTDLIGWVTTYLLAFALLGLLTLIVLAFTQLHPPPRQPHPS